MFRMKKLATTSLQLVIQWAAALLKRTNEITYYAVVTENYENECEQNTTKSMSRIFSIKQKNLIKIYALSTVAIGSSTTLGDFFCQYLERSDSEYHETKSLSWWSVDRTKVMGVTAICLTTPYSFFLTRTVEYFFPGKRWIQIAKKTVINGITAPIYISLMFTTVTLLKGQTLSKARDKIYQDMPQAFLIGNLYWPFVSLINFRFIALDYRPFISSIAGVLWNIYMSSVANKNIL